MEAHDQHVMCLIVQDLSACVMFFILWSVRATAQTTSTSSVVMTAVFLIMTCWHLCRLCYMLRCSMTGFSTCCPFGTCYTVDTRCSVDTRYPAGTYKSYIKSCWHLCRLCYMLHCSMTGFSDCSSCTCCPFGTCYTVDTRCSVDTRCPAGTYKSYINKLYILCADEWLGGDGVIIYVRHISVCRLIQKKVSTECYPLLINEKKDRNINCRVCLRFLAKYVILKLFMSGKHRTNYCFLHE